MTAPQPGTVSWQPANDTERFLAQALVQGDRREFFRLLANGELFLPAFAADRSVAGPQRFITVSMFGQTYLPVFTSVPGLTASMGPRVDAYTVTSYPELRRKWPDPAWRLAVNPGAPIDAYLTIEAVQDAALGDVRIPTVAEILIEGERSGVGEPQDPAAQLRSAIENRDTDAYLRALLETDVIVPVAAPASPEQVLEPGFPWLRVGGSPIDAAPDDQTPRPTIEVFTSAETFQAGYPQPVPSVTVAMPAVVAAWPDDEDQLAIDPRTPLAVTLPGGHVVGLVLWLRDEDGQEPADGVQPGPPDGAPPVQPEPVRRPAALPPAGGVRKQVELPPWATGR